ncbi:hypothetical protein QC762_401847 [Podospora pseudocomata]|uniref:Uncharacterized protein n=1 Tax=Podospora pseudocomata TaxID=2093779 RepID=A0ABR0GEX0_9PEZI|nr:hypothetical protein QC762_401847 [Podospora pseudocomata]
MRCSGCCIALFATVSVVANFLLLLTCVSPNVKDLALYRVNVTRLAEDLHSQVLKKTEDTSPKDLLHPNLPTYWLWGISGICDDYPDKAVCRRRFLPTQDILTLVEHSLTSGTDDGTQDETISKVLTTWNSTLTHLNSPEQHDRATKFAAISKAGVAIIIVVIILDILLLGPSLWWPSSKKRLPRVFYLISAVYGMIAIGAGIVMAVALPHGFHVAVIARETGVMTLINLFVGAGIRLVTSLIGCCFSCWDPDSSGPSRLPEWSRRGGVGQRPVVRRRVRSEMTLAKQVVRHEEKSVRSETPESDRVEDKEGSRLRPRKPLGDQGTYNEKIGYLGEKCIFDLFSLHNLPNWSGETNWTSSLRSLQKVFEDFPIHQEKHHADFTYHDTMGAMREALRQEGVRVSPSWSNNTKYHIEVKTTEGRCWAPMKVSVNQTRLMENYEGDANNVYILVRVFDVRGRHVGLRWFPEPRRRENLKFEGPKEGYYEVTTKNIYV